DTLPASSGSSLNRRSPRKDLMPVRFILSPFLERPLRLSPICLFDAVAKIRSMVISPFFSSPFLASISLAFDMPNHRARSATVLHDGLSPKEQIKLASRYSSHTVNSPDFSMKRGSRTQSMGHGVKLLSKNIFLFRK